MKALNKSKDFIIKHQEELCFAGAVAGFASATVLAVKATPKAMQKIEEAKKENELTNLDKVKLTWKCYIPTVAAFSAASLSLVAAYRGHKKFAMATTAALKVAETAYEDLKESTKEIVDETVMKEIDNKVSEKKVKRKEKKEKISDTLNAQGIVVTGDDVVVLEGLTGQVFKTRINDIEKAINNLNRKLISDNYISFDEYLCELDEIAIGSHVECSQLGYNLGWRVDLTPSIHMEYDSQLTADKKPVLVLKPTEPYQEYDK